MQRTWQTNLPLDLQDARTRGSGMILPMHCRYCSIRMKKSRRRCKRGIELSRLQHDEKMSQLVDSPY